MNLDTTLYFQNSNLEEVLEKEWIVTNGLGGYASSSLCGLNTRKYHGILIASINPPTERRVYVSNILEALIIKDQTVELSSNQFPGAIHPDGYQYLKEFKREPLPEFYYQYDKYKLIKSVFMVHNSNTTVVEYRNPNRFKIKLMFHPLLADRDFHHLFNKNDESNFQYQVGTDCLEIRSSPQANPLFFRFTNGEFTEQRNWFFNLEYREEMFRGLGFTEDAFSLGNVTAELPSGQSMYLVFSLDKDMMSIDPLLLKEQELSRLKKLVPKVVKNDFVRDLMVAGDQFVVKRKSTQAYSIIAGYHWFADWGRDTMISIRGLGIAAGKKEESKSILQTFLKYLDQGMLPNCFPDTGDHPKYNTVDAALWLFVAMYDYHEAFSDKEFLKEAMPLLESILDNHLKGTRYDIKVLNNGLLYAGNRDIQLTWMDAKIGDYTVTPRFGCAVEINALWYNALKIFGHFQSLLKGGKNDKIYEEIAEKVKLNFRPHFYNSIGYLNDVVIPDEWVDESIRPNQVYALSLPFSLLNEEDEKKVLENIKLHLYTDFGLRTLTPGHPNFRPVYEGDVWGRDTAYHQGTVWPFLLGEYFLAYLKVYKYSNKAKQEVEEMMESLKIHFYTSGCINGISEIFDGKNPSKGKGTAHQAWSVANLLLVILKAGLFKKSGKTKESKTV